MVKENKATDIILGLHKQGGISDSYLGNLTEGILRKCNVTTLIYKNLQPINTIERYLVVIPENGEREIGFPFWLLRIWNIGRNTGAKLVFYGSADTLEYIQQINKKFTIEAAFIEFSDWEDILIISRDLKENDALVMVLSRKNGVSFTSVMNKLPKYLNKYFNKNNYILIYPMQLEVDESGIVSYGGTSILNPLINSVERIDEFGKIVAKLFRKK